jgi:hypothetical protein
MVFSIPLFSLCMLTMGALSLLFAMSPEPWREAHRNQCQVACVVFMAGITAVAFATGQEMLVSFTYAAMTLFTAVLVVVGYVKRSRVSGRAS